MGWTKAPCPDPNCDHGYIQSNCPPLKVCPDCGNIVPNVYTCDPCNHTGHIDCPICHGDGYTKDRHALCQGTGEIDVRVDD